MSGDSAKVAAVKRKRNAINARKQVIHPVIDCLEQFKGQRNENKIQI